MRIDATSLQNLVSSVADLNTRETDIAKQMSSGVRLSQLSDDPTAAGQAATMADSLGRDDAFLASAATAGNRMQAADTVLSSVVTQLTAAVTTAVGAVNSGTDVSTAVTQLTAIRESLL